MTVCITTTRLYSSDTTQLTLGFFDINCHHNILLNSIACIYRRARQKSSPKPLGIAGDMVFRFFFDI